MLRNFVERKLLAARDLAVYSTTRLTRPAADRAIAQLAETNPTTDVDGAILCEALWDHPHHWLRVAMFRAACANEFGAGLVGVVHEGVDWRAHASLRSLPVSEMEMIPKSIANAHRAAAEDLLSDVAIEQDLLDLQLPGGFPAHLIYDDILKSNRLGEIDPARHRTVVLEKLSEALAYLEWYGALLNRHQINAVLVSHPTTVRFSALSHTALSRGIPVFVINYVNSHITIRRLTDCTELVGPCIDYPSIADRNGLDPEQRKMLTIQGHNYLNRIRNGTGGQISMLNAYKANGPTYPDRSELLRAVGIASDMPIAACLGNCFPDFPNAVGRTWFANYVEFIRITLEIAQQLPNSVWLLKPHPAEHHYGKTATLRTVVGNDLPANIRFWPEGAGGSDMLTHIDCIITSGGTAGVEYSASGRRVIAARQAPYSAWNFTHSATSKQHYAKLLGSAFDLPPPSQHQMDDAAIYAAMAFADSCDLTNDLHLPFGLNSYRLWPSIPAFIDENRVSILREIDRIRAWVRSDSRCYAVARAVARARDSLNNETRHLATKSSNNQ